MDIKLRFIQPVILDGRTYHAGDTGAFCVQDAARHIREGRAELAYRAGDDVGQVFRGVDVALQSSVRADAEAAAFIRSHETPRIYGDWLQRTRVTLRRAINQALIAEVKRS